MTYILNKEISDHRKKQSLSEEHITKKEIN